MTMDIIISEVLDASGFVCPLPLLKTKQALARLKTGDVLKVITTDAGSQRDFRSFARLSNVQLLHETAENDTYYFWLKKN